MNKTYMGLAIALVVAAGAGYGVYATMDGDKTGTAPQTGVEAPAIEQAAVEAASTEPAAAEEKAEADNPVVATINGKNLYRSDVVEFMETLPPQMRQIPAESIFPMILEQVINAKIIDQKASEADIAGDPEVEKQLTAAKTQIIRGVYAQKQIDSNYNESDTKAAYEKMVAEMPKVEEVKASHILVDDEAKATEIIKKLEGGAKFADLAKEYSKDKSNAANGGDLGYFAQGDMVKEFGDAAFALKKGEFTKTPVKTQFGYHVILQDDKRERPAPKYDDVKGELEGKVKRDLLNKMMEDWRATAKVERFDYNGKPLAEGQKDAE